MAELPGAAHTKPLIPSCRYGIIADRDAGKQVYLHDFLLKRAEQQYFPERYSRKVLKPMH
jgi:hypothetical protein